jgi:hypothetical protein
MRIVFAIRNLFNSNIPLFFPRRSTAIPKCAVVDGHLFRRPANCESAIGEREGRSRSLASLQRPGESLKRPFVLPCPGCRPTLHQDLSAQSSP